MTPISSRAFTLAEVVAALAVLGTVTAFAIALGNATGRSIAATAHAAHADQLTDPVLIELSRLRDSLSPEDHPDRLAALAALLPATEETSTLRFVAAQDGTRITPENDLGRPGTALTAAEGYYLVEVRPHSGSLRFLPESGFLAVSLRISWPYFSAGVAGRDSGAMIVNAALTP